MGVTLMRKRLEQPEGICGAVLSFRLREDMLTVWNHDSTNQQQIAIVKKQLCEILNVDKCEYLVHSYSTQANRQRAKKDKAAKIKPLPKPRSPAVFPTKTKGEKPPAAKSKLSVVPPAVQELAERYAKDQPKRDTPPLKPP